MTSASNLDDFMQEQDDYINEAIHGAATALLWQASDISVNGGNGFPMGEADNYTDAVSDLIRESVVEFVTQNYQLLLLGEVDAGQCGHDLILTANNHGAGFWDRGLDMPIGNPDALNRYLTVSRKEYRAWLFSVGPASRPESVGDYLTGACDGYSFDAEFVLWGDNADGSEHCSDELAWLMVENTVLLDDLGWSSEPAEASDDAV